MSEITEKLNLIENCIKLGQFSKAKTLVDRMKLDDIPSPPLNHSGLFNRLFIALEGHPPPAHRAEFVFETGKERTPVGNATDVAHGS